MFSDVCQFLIKSQPYPTRGIHLQCCWDATDIILTQIRNSGSPVEKTGLSPSASRDYDVIGYPFSASSKRTTSACVSGELDRTIRT